MDNPVKGLSSSSAWNRERGNRKYNRGLILTGNRHKQQVWERGREREWLLGWCRWKSFCYMTGLSWKRLRPGPVWWVDEGAAQIRVFSMTKVFSLPPPPLPPSVRGLGSSKGPWSLSGPLQQPRHVSNSSPASGTTNTVMSSPEPSLSLGNRQPRSLSTPRDLISRSWAASVYLSHRGDV